MRILVISNLYPPEFLGGYEVGCAQMVDELRARGHDVRVLTSVSASSPRQSEEHIERALELPPIYTPSRMDTVPPALYRHFQALACAISPGNARAIASTLERFPPEVVYLWNVLGVGGLGVIAQLDQAGLPWVWHLMDSIPRQLCTFIETGGAIPRQFSQMVSGRYIVCSSHLRGEIEAAGVGLSGPVEVVPNWIAGPPPPPRTRFFAGDHLRVMAASGVVSEAKGTRVLIDAAAHLRDLGFGNFSIDIYGHEQEPGFRRLLHTRDVAHHVRLLGPRRHEDLLTLYGEYDVFAFPTWSREPFGIAPLEAGAHGCVPLVTADCGYAEWAVDGVDCLKAPRHAAAFAARLAQAITGEVDLSAIGRRAQAVASRDFHVSRAAEPIERLLSDAAVSRRPGSAEQTDFHALAAFAEGVIQALLVDLSAP